MNRWLEPPPHDRPLVIGHRGASAHAPDNSLQAFRLAKEQGADGIELDVRLSSDGHVVLRHDADIPDLGPVAHHPLSTLREAVPHMAVLDDLLAADGDLLLDIEIKSDARGTDFDSGDRMVCALAEWVEANEVEDRVLVSSFDPGAVERVRELAPNVPTGLLLRHGLRIRREMERAAAAGHEWLLPRSAALRVRPKRLLREARTKGLRLGTWTVDAAWELRWYRRAGLDAVITNDPRRALAAYS